MASFAPRRSTTASPGSRTLSLDEWEANAPLSESAKRSAAWMGERAKERPLPEKFTRPQTPETPRPALPSHLRPTSPNGSTPSSSPRRTRSMLNLAALTGTPPGSRPGTPAQQQAQQQQPIATPQQFLEWFGRVEQAMEHEHEDIYRAHLSELEGYEDACAALLKKLELAEERVGAMLEGWRFVEERSSSLKSACENLLEEQDRLLQATDDIAARLAYFKELEHATRLLNLPGESLVMRDDFLSMLNRLDECLAWLDSHRSYKDASLYLIRFQQCLTRSLTLIKMYFITSLRSLAQSITPLLAVSSATQSHLLYAKFRAAAPPLRVLIQQLERRAKRQPDEYESLLTECWAAYLGIRAQVVGPGVKEEVGRLDLSEGELVGLTRMGCGYIKQLSVDEFELYKEFFASGEDQFYDFLSNLSDNLHDHLRPRILHEPKLDTLCEVCTVLQALMVPSSGGDGEDEAESAAPTPEGTGELGPSLEVAELLRPLLQDAQTRLVFRAQSVLQSEIQHYVPKDADLDYPAKIEAAREAMAKAPALPEGREDTSRDELFDLPASDVQEAWYPTLRKTFWVLSRLHSFVDPAIFDDLAQEAVSLCRASLSTAAVSLVARDGAQKDCGTLFLIRHLLVLKEMTARMELVQRESGVDFSGVGDALSELLKNRSAIFNPNALFALGSRAIPRVVESLTDAKMEIDHALKTACEDLLSSCAADASAPLSPILSQASGFLAASASASAQRSRLAEQEWAAPEKLSQAHDAFRRGAERAVGETVQKMKQWLDDEKTVKVLGPPMLDAVVAAYSPFWDLVRTECGPEVAAGLATPSALRLVLREALEKAEAQEKIGGRGE